MHCFNKTSGEVLWKRDLAKEFSPSFDRESSAGYSVSPVAYTDTVIVPVGRAAESTPEPAGGLVVALEQSTGKVVWRSLDLLTPFSSPILVQFHGEDQLVLYATPGLVGVNPSDGRLLWSHAVKEPGAIQTPIWGDDGLIFCGVSAVDHVGSVVKLKREGARTLPTELWSSRKVRLSLATPVREGGRLYGCTEQGVLSVDMATGKRDWLARGFPSPSLVYGDGKLIILDQDGGLALATPTAEKLIVHSKCRVTERYSLTAPTLVGTTLYVRDRKHIMALDLGE
jgi:outer membrane protein assembly factor BamB